MPSTTNTLLTRFTSKISHLRTHLTPNKRRSSPPTDTLPITHSGLTAFHRRGGRNLTRSETDVLYAQAQWDVEAAPALAADTSQATSSSSEEDDAWSWMELDERAFSVAAAAASVETRAERTPEIDLAGEDDDWREDWAPIGLALKAGAKRRVVVTTIEEKHDSGYCDYDYSTVLEALQKSEGKGRHEEEEEEEEDREREYLEGIVKKYEKIGRDACLGSSRAVFTGRVRKQLRQVALEDVDDDKEEDGEETRDPGSMRMSGGDLACGDAWWVGL